MLSNMRVGATVVVMIMSVVVGVIMLFSSCSLPYISHEEYAFEYRVLSGKPVSEKDNPLLSVGYHPLLGWHNYVFSVTRLAPQCNFRNAATANVADEDVVFDSNEGVSMSIDVAIRARVENVWLFYANYGKSQYTYSAAGDCKTGNHLYEAIREAYAYLSAQLNETTQNKEAKDIREKPGELLTTLLSSTRTYMKQFGVYVEDVTFSGTFEYPDGAAIKQTTEMLGAANTDFENAKNKVKLAEQQKEQKLAEARREAASIVSTAAIEADRLTKESTALADELSASVGEIGPEATVRLYVARQLATLAKSGAIPRVTVTGDSVLGSPFYPSTK